MRFELQNPTRLVFGAGVLRRLGEKVRPLGSRAMIVTGRGSARASGLVGRAAASLEAAGVAHVVLEGVEPNPRLTTVRRGAELARAEAVEVIVALGGGSVMDAAKVMAAAVFYEGDPWDMIVHGGPQRLPTRALPVVTVPTLAATGSEMNAGAVITNEATTEKSYVIADCLFPRLALVDPELTMSVPPDHTAYGVVDLVTHVTEGYLNGVDGTPLQDRWAEGVIQVALEYGPRAVADGRDLEARTQVQWASVVALNGWVQAGCAAPYPVHGIEHVLSAHHDVAHGAGLAVVSPAWMRHAARARPSKLVGLAERVLGVRAAGPEDRDAALEGVARLEAFFARLGCATRLAGLGIEATPERLERWAEDTLRINANREGKLAGRPAMTREDVVALLRAAA